MADSGAVSFPPISPWLTLLLCVPVLLLGEQLVRRIPILARFKIPAPVVGGLVFSLLMLAVAVSGIAKISLLDKTDNMFWSWLTVAWPELTKGPSAPELKVYQPFLIAFFTSIGLGASARQLRSAGVSLIIFLGLAAVVVTLQNALGTGLAIALGENPLFGLVCGSVSLSGGHGTALGFAGDFKEYGVEGAGALGLAAATMGLIGGGILGAPLGDSIIQRYSLAKEEDDGTKLTGKKGRSTTSTQPKGFLHDLISYFSSGPLALLQDFLVMLICLKGGAWLSLGFDYIDLTVPVYVGGLVVGILLRNGTDVFCPGLVDLSRVPFLGTLSLNIFLGSALMTTDLAKLADTAGPMAVILGGQFLMVMLFSRFVTFRVMGRDYDAAVTAAGHVGFGLGSTPTAIASMQSLCDRYGPAPRAFLTVPVVGAFFIDIVNVAVLTVFINIFH